MGGERGDIPEKNRGEHFLLLKYTQLLFLLCFVLFKTNDQRQILHSSLGEFS